MPPDERLLSKFVSTKKKRPIMGSNDPQGRIGVAGPKGGGEAAKAQVEVGSPIFQQYNNDGKYGYYNNQGYYVPADIDMRDGGGMDTTDTFFKGGGLMSLLGNIAKIKPYGQKDTPREQIGFRNVADMFDRGGPQHYDGKYRGGGKISMFGNMLDQIGGVNQGTRTRYNYDTVSEPVQTNTGGFINTIEPKEPIPAYDLDGNPQNDAALVETADKAIESGVEPLYKRGQVFSFENRKAAIEALGHKGNNFKDFMQEHPAEAEELIKEAIRMQIPTGV